ncbi:MAG: hypothetical protein HGA31_00950 [Candidatus Moranbacteria bacterium]|nr:hypothetical protein [Candidatus Moranbacteria bacterium]
MSKDATDELTLKFEKSDSRDATLFTQILWAKALSHGCGVVFGQANPHPPLVAHFVHNGLIETWVHREGMLWLSERILKENTKGPAFLEGCLEEYRKSSGNLAALRQEDGFSSQQSRKAYVDAMYEAAFCVTVFSCIGIEDLKSKASDQVPVGADEINDFFAVNDAFVRDGISRVAGISKEQSGVVLPHEIDDIPLSDMLERRLEAFLLVDGHETWLGSLDSFTSEHPEYEFMEKTPGDRESAGKNGAVDEDLFVLRTRENDLSPAYWNSLAQTSRLSGDIYGRSLSVMYNVFFDGIMTTVVPVKEYAETGEYIAERLISEEGYYERIAEAVDAAKKDALRFLDTIGQDDFEVISDNELHDIAERIRGLFSAYDASSMFSFTMAGEPFRKKITVALGLPEDELDAVSCPKQDSYVLRMERDILKIALEHDPILSAISEQLSQHYYWIPFGYDGPNIWDETYFLDRICENRARRKNVQVQFKEMEEWGNHLKQRAEQIRKTYFSGRREKRWLEMLRNMATWAEDRKMIDYRLFYEYKRVLDELSVRTGISSRHLKFLFTEELRDLGTRGAELKGIAEHRMGGEFVSVTSDGNIRIATEEESRKVSGDLKNADTVEDISGMAASWGPERYYRARVKVLRSARENDKVKSGDILVTSMTTPQFAPAAEHALGFITDEGGITCDAAVIAREKGKPCIIGTKNATHILHDGDIVEMDIETGSVRIVERHE